MDVSDVLVDYLAGIGHLGKRTQVGYQQRLSVFAEWCSGHEVQLEHINNRTVQAFLVWLVAHHTGQKKGQALSTHTIAGYVRCIWALLYWCLDDSDYQGYVKLQTVKGIKMPRVEQKIKSVFTDEEIAALFTACTHASKSHEYQVRDTAILAVLLDSGIRAAELRTLTISNVTLAQNTREDSYITVHGKGNKWREVPLGNRARRALSRYMRQYRRGAKGEAPVFLSRYGGPMAHESLVDILLRLKADSGLTITVNPHKFRHSYAARFMSQGGDIYDLSRFLGHTSVAVTEGYIRSLGASSLRKRHKERPSVLDHL